jgi:hypothetical protein
MILSATDSVPFRGCLDNLYMRRGIVSNQAIWGNRNIRRGALFPAFSIVPHQPISPTCLPFYDYPFFAIFAQESTSETVRLKTGRAGVESGSTQK